MRLPKPLYTVERDEKHNYRTSLDPDTWLPGVTGILEVVGGASKTAALIGWASKESLAKVRTALLGHLGEPISEGQIEAILKEARKRPKQILEAAGDIGTRAHAVIDQLVRGRKVKTMDEDVKPVVEGFMDWWKSSGYRFVSGDLRVASWRHKYGGSLDALAEKNGSLVVLDWKTSNATRDEYSFQIGAYSNAFNETYDLQPDLGVCVRFDKKTASFEHREVYDLAEAFNGFLNAKALSDSLKRPLWKDAGVVVGL